MSEAESWEWEDPEIPDESVLLRRVPKKPSHLGVDLLSGEPLLTPAALSYDRYDGLSVFQLTLLRERCEADVAAINTDWSTHGAASFTAGVVRSAGMGDVGVVGDPTNDPKIGEAHSSVRHRDRATGHQKSKWNPIRAEIIRTARWIDRPEGE